MDFTQQPSGKRKQIGVTTSRCCELRPRISVIKWRLEFGTTERGSHLRSRRRCSTHSLQPNRPARAPGLACPSVTISSSNNMRGGLKLRPSQVSSLSSGLFCRAREPYWRKVGARMNLLILVVDDEPDVAELFRQQFRRDLRAGRFSMQFAQS